MSIRKIAFSSFILLALSFTVSAQKNKGDVYYAHYDYRDAIQFYLKAVASNPKDSASLSHLAKCYGVVRDYDNAEVYYAKAAAINGISPNVLFNYAEILKNNGKIDEARAQFAEYSVMVPSDTNAKAEIRYCDHLKQKFYVAYQVSMLEGLNSGFSDFAPVIYNDNLVFVSDRGTDMVNFEKSNVTGSNFYKMYMAKPLTKGFDKPALFSKTVNGSQSDNSIGPVSFSADGKILFFTKVAALRKKNFINQVKIYYCESDGSGWSAPQPFPFNSDTYSNMDPAISPDGQQLFFSSNMPGGFGGTDIYVSQKTSTGWSQPQNLGSEVNTPGNEAFPYMRKDGTLFFASDRHFNYGGLDMFSTTLKGGKWTNVENLGPDINSSTDDFGICFNSNGHTGYFSSNRKGGTGKDDIYSFLYIGNYSPLKGIILFSYNINDPAASVGVKLLDDSGKVISTGQTDKNGAFTFNKLEPDKKYMVQVDEEDPRFAGKKKFYLADSTGKIVGVTILNSTKKGKYVFTALPADITTLGKIDATDKNINLAGNLLRGDSSKPIANAKVNLLNAQGEIIATTTTNAFGSFVFTNLPPDEPYSFQVVTGPGDDSKLPPNTKVVLTDKNGNTVKTYIVSPDGKFHFEILAGDTASIAHMEVDDSQLRFEIKNVLLDDQKKAMANTKVSLIDKDGKVIQSTTTDAEGNFAFTNLPADVTYFVAVDQTDPRLGKMNKLYLADSKHNIIRELNLKNGFKYAILAADEKSMGTLSVYDPWIEALNLKKQAKKDSMFIIENVYYDYQDYKILPAAARVLDKVVSVMKANPEILIELDAYTDSRGAADFNLDLSQKRAAAAVDYMVKHGADKKKLMGKGLGKAHQLNNCGDPGVTCTEEQFAVNRRTEFKITKAVKK